MASNTEINNITRPVYEVLMKEVNKRPVKITASNIQALTDEELNMLKCGDVVAKKTGNQYHRYVVSYKEDNHGICLTYLDASCVETISYDYIEGHWVYNSKDVSQLPINGEINGDLEIIGDLEVTGESVFNDDVAINGNLTGDSIVENMSGYSYVKTNVHEDITPIYVGVVKNGNKLTLVWFVSLTATATQYEGIKLGDINLPEEVASKIYPFTLSGIDNLVDDKVVPFMSGYNTRKNATTILQKYTNALLPKIYIYDLTIGTTYLARYEATFLLSENMAL